MASDVPSLPHEPDALIEIIVELRNENGRLRAMLETARRALYGARSERLGEDPGQLALGLEDISAVPVKAEQDAAQLRPHGGPTRRKPVRNIGSLPRHLPREEIVIEPAIETCPCCRGVLHRIGEDVSEMLDIVPAIIRVRCIRRPRYGCRACEGTVLQAPAPPRPIEGGLPTAALLAHVAAAKFAWHLPLQARLVAREPGTSPRRCRAEYRSGRLRFRHLSLSVGSAARGSWGAR